MKQLAAVLPDNLIQNTIFILVGYNSVDDGLWLGTIYQQLTTTNIYSSGIVSLFSQSYTAINKIEFPYNISRQSMIIIKTRTA